MYIFAASYMSTAACMLALDFIWLSMMMPRLYRPLLRHLLADTFSIVPTIILQLLYVTGIVVLVVLPAIDTGNWIDAAFKGLILGTIGYGTYDLTNQATLRCWPVTITLIDLAWGASLTSAASIAGYFGGTLFVG